jgi:hypothetical protein
MILQGYFGLNWENGSRKPVVHRSGFRHTRRIRIIPLAASTPVSPSRYGEQRRTLMVSSAKRRPSNHEGPGSLADERCRYYEAVADAWASEPWT